MTKDVDRDALLAAEQRLAELSRSPHVGSDEATEGLAIAAQLAESGGRRETANEYLSDMEAQAEKQKRWWQT